MSNVRKRTFSVAEEQADYIDAKVASGDYASASEVVREGLRALKEQDAAVERWLRETIVPRLEALDADPSRGIPAETVFANIRARLKERYKDRT